MLRELRFSLASRPPAHAGDACAAITALGLLRPPSAPHPAPHPARPGPTAHHTATHHVFLCYMYSTLVQQGLGALNEPCGFLCSLPGPDVNGSLVGDLVWKAWTDPGPQVCIPKKKKIDGCVAEGMRLRQLDAARAGGKGAKRPMQRGRQKREEADAAGGAAQKKPRSVSPHQRQRSTCKECRGAGTGASGAYAGCAGGGASARTSARGAHARSAGGWTLPAPAQQVQQEHIQGVRGGEHMPAPASKEQRGGASICQHQRIRSQCKECRQEADEGGEAGARARAGVRAKRERGPKGD